MDAEQTNPNLVFTVISLVISPCSICNHLFFYRVHFLSLAEGKKGTFLWEKLVISMPASSVVFCTLSIIPGEIGSRAETERKDQRRIVMLY